MPPTNSQYSRRPGSPAYTTARVVKKARHLQRIGDPKPSPKSDQVAAPQASVSTGGAHGDNGIVPPSPDKSDWLTDIPPAVLELNQSARRNVVARLQHLVQRRRGTGAVSTLLGGGSNVRGGGQEMHIDPDSHAATVHPPEVANPAEPIGADGVPLKHLHPNHLHESGDQINLTGRNESSGRGDQSEDIEIQNIRAGGSVGDVNDPRIDSQQFGRIGPSEGGGDQPMPLGADVRSGGASQGADVSGLELRDGAGGRMYELGDSVGQSEFIDGSEQTQHIGSSEGGDVQPMPLDADDSDACTDCESEDADMSDLEAHDGDMSDLDAHDGDMSDLDAHDDDLSNLEPWDDCLDGLESGGGQSEFIDSTSLRTTGGADDANNPQNSSEHIEPIGSSEGGPHQPICTSSPTHLNKVDPLPFLHTNLSFLASDQPSSKASQVPPLPLWAPAPIVELHDRRTSWGKRYSSPSSHRARQTEITSSQNAPSWEPFPIDDSYAHHSLDPLTLNVPNTSASHHTPPSQMPEGVASPPPMEDIWEPLKINLAWDERTSRADDGRDFLQPDNPFAKQPSYSWEPEPIQQQNNQEGSSHFNPNFLGRLASMEVDDDEMNPEVPHLQRAGRNTYNRKKARSQSYASERMDSEPSGFMGSARSDPWSEDEEETKELPQFANNRWVGGILIHAFCPSHSYLHPEIPL